MSPLEAGGTLKGAEAAGKVHPLGSRAASLVSAKLARPAVYVSKRVLKHMVTLTMQHLAP